MGVAPPLSPTAAAKWLNAYRLPTLAEALDGLRRLRAEYHLLTLYEHYFPQQFKVSKARRAGDVRQAEKEFLKLVDARLFPICDWVLDEIEPGEQLEYIPIAQINFLTPWQLEDELRYSTGENVSPALRVFAALITGDLSAWEEIEQQVEMSLPQPVTGGEDTLFRCDWDQFQSLCRQAGRRMAGVPEALDVLGHETGNFFIDFDEEFGWESFDWNVATMDQLIDQARRAEPILRRCRATQKWLTADPRRLARLIALWNKTSKKVSGECQSVTCRSVT